MWEMYLDLLRFAVDQRRQNANNKNNMWWGLWHNPIEASEIHDSKWGFTCQWAYVIQMDFWIIYFIYVFNFHPNVHPEQLLHNIMQLSYAPRISLDMQTVKVTID